MNRPFISLGALLGFTAVAAGAFGAHLLRNPLTLAQLEIFQTAARYQMYHALALLFVGSLPAQARRLTAAGWCFLGGTLIFSGSLYGLSLSGLAILGLITPLGGLALLSGWGLLLWWGLTAPTNS